MKSEDKAEKIGQVMSHLADADQPAPDFESWLREHPQAVKNLTSCAERTECSIFPSAQNIWRKIMKNSYVRYASAAVIFLGVSLGIYLFISVPKGSNIVWAEVAERVGKIPTVLCREQTTYERPQGVEEIPGLPDTQATIYISSRYGKRQDVYVNGELRGNVFFLAPEQIMMALDHEEKTYQRVPMTETIFRQMQQVNDPRDLLQKLKTEMSYVQIGCKKIKDVEVEGIQIEGEELARFGDPVLRIWASRKSQLPVQMEFELTLPLGGKNGIRQKRVIKDFQWDIELNETVFTPQIPAGYREVQKTNSDSHAINKAVKAAEAKK